MQQGALGHCHSVLCCDRFLSGFQGFSCPSHQRWLTRFLAEETTHHLRPLKSITIQRAGKKKKSEKSLPVSVFYKVPTCASCLPQLIVRTCLCSNVVAVCWWVNTCRKKGGTLDIEAPCCFTWGLGEAYAVFFQTYLFALIVAIKRMFYNEQRKPQQAVPKWFRQLTEGRAFCYEDVMSAYIFFLISGIHFTLALESDFIFKYESDNVAKTTSLQAFHFATIVCWTSTQSPRPTGHLFFKWALIWWSKAFQVQDFLGSFASHSHECSSLCLQGWRRPITLATGFLHRKQNVWVRCSSVVDSCFPSQAWIPTWECRASGSTPPPQAVAQGFCWAIDCQCSSAVF